MFSYLKRLWRKHVGMPIMVSRDGTWYKKRTYMLTYEQYYVKLGGELRALRKDGTIVDTPRFNWVHRTVWKNYNENQEQD